MSSLWLLFNCSVRYNDKPRFIAFGFELAFDQTRDASSRAFSVLSTDGEAKLVFVMDPLPTFVSDLFKD